MPVITLLYKRLIYQSDEDIDHNRQDIVEIINYTTELEKFCQRMEIDTNDLTL